MGAVEQPLLLQRHRITVDEYYRMADAGVLAPDARVELIDGEIIDMAAMKSRHAGVVNELHSRLQEVLGRRAVITCQTPLRLSNRSEPEPDLMLLRPRHDRYTQSHPAADDVLLLVEVADSSARYDREIKVPLYARHAVPEVWVMDLDAMVLHVYRNPLGDAYADVSALRNFGTMPMPAFPGLAVDLADLLP